MTERNFMTLLNGCWDYGKFVCVGLDSDVSQLPPFQRRLVEIDGRAVVPSLQLDFNRRIIQATTDEVCAIKPNSAFYESEGDQGLRDLRATVSMSHHYAPGAVVIVDYKRGDIGNTNNGYIAAAFDVFGADAVTIHPYLGMEAMKPFLDRGDKGIIVLCRTSNEGAGEFQDRLVVPTPGEAEKWGITTNPMPLYELVAYRVSREWNYNGNCAVVVGATYPAELARVRAIVGNMPILIPGVGAQGGTLEDVVPAGKTTDGRGMIINASRSVIFASKGADFAEAAANEVQAMNRVIRPLSQAA